MGRRGKKRKRPGGDWVTPPSRPRSTVKVPRDMRRPPDLLQEVRRLMRSPDPLDLIAHVSGLVAATDPRSVSPMERRQFDAPSITQLTRSFIDVETIETSALLAVIEVLVDDEKLRSEIGRELGRRAHILPSWLARLRETVAYRAVETVHLLGDGENILVGVRLPEGHELTSILYVDHNLGTVAKDGFVVDQPIASVVEMLRDAGDAHTAENDIALADARARTAQAIEHGAMTFPPFETETWPAARPVVEWIARLLPDGGRGFERPEWTEKAKDDLARRFFASPVGRPLDDVDHRDLLESILWYGTDYGPGDPMRWSPTAAEILLLDWIPRKIVADAEFLAAAPELLSAFVRFCDTERGIPAELTDETLGAIRVFAPEYRKIISSPRLQGPAALLARMGVIDPDAPGWLGEGAGDLPSFEEIMLDALRRAVGGDEALQALDDRPLPDEAFDWSGIPEDIRPKVEEVMGLCDGCSTALFDLEFRTACRRLLARAASGDPQIFRRKARSDTAAAAICWIIGKANGLLSRSGGPYVKDLAEHFGLVYQTFSQRATTLLAAVGVTDRFYGDVYLGSPAFLTSVRRREIITRRERYV